MPKKKFQENKSNSAILEEREEESNHVIHVNYRIVDFNLILQFYTFYTG